MSRPTLSSFLSYGLGGADLPELLATTKTNQNTSPIHIFKCVFYNSHLDWSKLLGIAPCEFSKRGGSNPVVLVATRGENCKLTSTILNVKANTPTNVFFYYYYYLCVDCCRFLCSDMQVALSEICAQLLC
jgi:hypothetical protein